VAAINACLKNTRLTISAMAAVHLLLLMLLFLTIEWWEGSQWIGDSCLGLVASQGYLLGLWAALGGRPTSWRAILLLLIAECARVVPWWHLLVPPNIVITWIGQAFQATVILLAARFLGLGLTNREEDGTTQQRLQFSVGQALSWVAGLAVFMGAMHYLADPFRDYYATGSFPSSGLAVPLAAMWLILGNRWTELRCFTLLAIIVFWIVSFVRAGDMPWWQAANLLGCEAATTAASLVVVRLAGYRLVWRWHF
jgi:hypothetical protein